MFFGGSTVTQVLAEHYGAKKCKEEDIRGGAGNLFGTGPGYGFRPDNADKRELKVTAAVLAASGIAYITHHHKVADGILLYGGAAAYGGGIGTFWGTCN